MSFGELIETLFDECLSVFGEETLYMPKEGEPFRLVGIFVKDYQLLQEGQFDSVLSTSAPALEVSTKNLKGRPQVGDRIKVRNESYRITELQPNGEGQIKLILKKGEKL